MANNFHAHDVPLRSADTGEETNSPLTLLQRYLKPAIAASLKRETEYFEQQGMDMARWLHSGALHSGAKANDVQHLKFDFKVETADEPDPLGKLAAEASKIAAERIADGSVFEVPPAFSLDDLTQVAEYDTYFELTDGVDRYRRYKFSPLGPRAVRATTRIGRIFRCTSCQAFDCPLACVDCNHPGPAEEFVNLSRHDQLECAVPPTPSVHDLEALLERSKSIVMTDEQKRRQAENFAYYNLKIDRPSLTREEFDACL